MAGQLIDNLPLWFWLRNVPVDAWCESRIEGLLAGRSIRLGGRTRRSIADATFIRFVRRYPKTVLVRDIQFVNKFYRRFRAKADFNDVGIGFYGVDDCGQMTANGRSVDLPKTEREIAAWRWSEKKLSQQAAQKIMLKMDLDLKTAFILSMELQGLLKAKKGIAWRIN